jgi:hypothetical protein
MRAVSSFSAFAPLAAIAVLSACATVEIPPAVTDIASRACATSVDLTKAAPLAPPKPDEARQFTVTAKVDSSFPCVEIDGAKATFALFSMPAEPTQKTITVGGVFEAVRIFAPIVQTLDANGSPLRIFDGDDFLVRGALYSAQFRPRTEEAYILVRSAAGLAGGKNDQIRMGINSTSTFVPGVGAISINTGGDTAASRTFSHEGVVQVIVADPRPPQAEAKKR